MKQGNIYLRDTGNVEISFPIKRENITTERNFKISEQEMYSNDGKNHSTGFYHNGEDGFSFQCTAIFTKSEEKTMTLLDTWYRELHSFNLVFDKSINLKLPLINKQWIITKITPKQEMDNITEWNITFRTYNPPKKITAIKNNLVNRTTKSYKWQANCKKHYSNLNYSKMKNKSGNDCSKLLNTILNELGYKVKEKNKIPTKYTKKTSAAVKKFKREWNTYKLKPKFKNTSSDKIDKTGFQNIGNYAQLKSAKKKK